MGTPQANTKIERAVESIESLVIAVVAATGASDATERASSFATVADARAECATAFREFVEPVLRVVKP